MLSSSALLACLLFFPPSSLIFIPNPYSQFIFVQISPKFVRLT